jgi:hypothetical protein
MNATPNPGTGASDRDAFSLTSARIAADASARAASAQHDGTDSRIAAQNKLYSILGISGGGALFSFAVGNQPQSRKRKWRRSR